MRIRALAPAALAASVLLAGCVPATEGARPSTSLPASSAPATIAGLEDVIGRDAAMLGRLFGKPDLDIREGSARKLQYSSEVCVLDTYLYPRAGGGDPLVTWVDARLPDGREVDRASCVAALRLK